MVTAPTFHWLKAFCSTIGKSSIASTLALTRLLPVKVISGSCRQPSAAHALRPSVVLIASPSNTRTTVDRWSGDLAKISIGTVAPPVLNPR